MRERLRRLVRRAALVFIGALIFGGAAFAQSVTGTIDVGAAPAAAATNPLTNTIYVLNSTDGTVTVINGATGQVIGPAITVGSDPVAVAVNPVTNMIYVANKGSGSVTPISGATNVAGSAIPVGTSPVAIAVNPVSGTVYVANYGSNNVTPISANTAGSPIAVGTNPTAIAVNPVTNMIYVANYGSNNVTPINGSSNLPGAAITVGTNPIAIAVNSVTGTVYVANNGSSNVTPISANTAGAAIAAGTNPIAIAVNPLSNTIYVANNGSGNIAVINGMNNSSSTVTDATASAPIAVAINLLTNTVYVANNGSSNVTAINGVQNAVVTSPAAGTNPIAIAINPVTGMAYVANNGSANVTVISNATYAVSSISDSSFSSPNAIAVNPVTNEVYVANNDSSGSDTVSVINPASNNSVSTVTDSSAVGPTAIAVNPATNTIYVANEKSGTITIINAANSNQVTTITQPGTSQPVALAANPVTNAIYVANSATNNVTAINAANNNHVSVIYDPSALGPAAVAVNPATGQVYVANAGSDTVSVFDGVTGLYVASITVGTYPQAIAVNPATNTVYVANADGSSVTVINGATNLVTTTVAVSNSPVAVAVNPITNQIYVAGAGNETGSVTVINGATNATMTITAASLLSPNAIAVNPTTNKIYVADYDGYVTAIDGVTNTAFAVTDTNAQQPFAVAVNPVTNDAYVANYYSDNATAVSEQQVQSNALQTTITALTNNQTATETPSFSFTTTNGLTSNAADNLVYQFDSWTGPWTAAVRGTPTGNSVAFNATVATPLEPGFHILYAFATDGEDGTSVNTGGQSSPLIGTIAAYGFLVAPPVGTAFPPTLTFATQTQNTSSAAQTVYLANEGEASLTFTYGFSGTNGSDFTEGPGDTCSSQGGTLAAGASCTVFVVFTPTTTSSESASLIFTDNSNGVSGSMQSIALSGTGSTIPTFTLNIGESGTGSGTVSSNPTGIACQPTCSASYPSGTQIVLTESAGVGSGFVQWSGACSGSTPTCTITITADTSVSAAFSLTGTTACSGTTTNWIGGSGNWSDAAMWVGGSVPASGANVCIADGTPGTSSVTLDETVTVGNLYIDSGDTLTISNNTTLTVTGSISNAGQISISAATTTAALIISGSVSLSGGGTVSLSTTGAGGTAYIYQYGGSTLTNVNNKIQGAGEIGYNGLSVVNGAGGTINANLSGSALYVNPSGLTNQGLLEATGGGILELAGGVTFNNAGANITANGSGSMVEFLSGPTIQGGTLTTVSGGSLGTLNSGNTAALDASTHGAITIVGTYSITNNTSTYVTGTINNTNTSMIQIAAGTTTAALIVETSATLTGGGTVSLSTTGAGFAYIYQYGGSTLTNVNNKIQGAGEIGYNGLAVVNGAGGVINANTSGSALELDPSGLTNQGLLEATNGGILELAGGVTFNNTGANITASGTGSMVEFLSGPTIQGGTLTTGGGGSLGTLNSGNTATLDASTHGAITIVGTYSITNNTSTYVTGTINNTGAIQIAAGTTTAALIVETNLTLTGSGLVMMSTTGAGSAYIYQYGGSTLTNVNNTIQGTGVIGYNGLAVINGPAGIIDANTSGNTLEVDPSGFNNQGLLEATGGGILELAGGVTFINEGANITANGSGSIVELLSGPTIQGGTLTTAGGGSLGTLNSGNSATLDASTHGAITIVGTYSITNNTSTYVTGTINNAGAIQIAAGTTTAALIVETSLTLTGGGSVSLSTTGAGGTAYIYQYGGSTLTNVNNTIQGTGIIGYNGLAVINEAGGVINANALPTGSVLELDPSALTNTGLVEATNGAVLQLAGGANFNNAGGSIVANGTGSTVQLLSSPTIQGGTLKTIGGGSLGTLVSGNNATLDASTHGAITIAGAYSLTNNTSTYAFGTINNIGVIQIEAGTTTTALIVETSLNLTGGGTVTMSTTGAGGTAYIYQYGGSTLTNVNNTIQGTGIIGYNGLAVVNEGTINANTAGVALQITTSALTNQGLLESTGTGTLQLSTPVTNSGEIVPDGSPNPGTISISNNLTQTSAGSEGVVLDGLAAGTQYSQLNISGTANLSGALDVGFANGFTPLSGNQFTVLTANTISGTFSSINSAALPGDLIWALTYNFSSVPQAVVLTAQTGTSTSQTLTVAELGTGAGTVTDSVELIDCSEANGITTGTCSASYETGSMITLTASPAPPSTFAGWGGACASSGTSSECTVTMSAAQSVTANFAAAPVSVNITFPAGNDSAQMATFNCPSNPNPTPANPCTDPNAHALQLTIPNVNTSFTVTVTATEVPPTQADGICENGNTVLNDFDCRFTTFFPGSTIASGVVTPLCYPYANGNCVHYVVYSGTQGTEPNPANYSGGVNWEITWNNDSFTPPAPYWTGSTPRLFDDPDSPPTPSAAYGTLCTQPMLIGSAPQMYSCQFEFDITTFFNPTKKVDSGIGGSTKAFNDVVVAFPPTTEIPPQTAPAITSASSTTFTAGSTGFFLITETGNPAPTLTVTGTLPSGVTLNTDTGILGGTPATGTGGTYPLSLTASNGVSPNATQNFTLNVNEAPAITSANATTFTVGSLGTFNVTASGFPLPTFSETGALPSGVTFNTTSGVLSGTPGVGTAGIYNFTITAMNSIGSSAAQAFTLTVSQASGTVTLSVTELGTGAGMVADNLQKISCSEASGVGSGTCSYSYANPTTVILTESLQNASTTFAGWGGACASAGTTATCQITLSTSTSVTANFLADPATMNLTFPAGANSSQMATFDCPSNANPTPANPCADPNAHALQFTIPNVSTSFTVTVLATEVPPTMADGLCEKGNTVLNDFDCRFVTFFGDGTDSNGDTIVPLCYPYANGNCVHYLVYYGTQGNEPPAADYSGGVYWEITWNNDTVTPPGPYWSGSTPQLYDDPDGPASIGSIGTSCSQPMTLNGRNQNYACQFEFNITTFYDPTKPVDAGIGGSTKAFNDVVVAFPPTVAGTQPVEPPPTATTPAISGTCLSGCVNTASTINFSTGTGGTFQVIPAGYPAPLLTESGALPSGITLNNVTGILGGTPAAGTTGNFPISFTATNSIGTTTANFTLTVNQGPMITSLASTTFTVGSAGTFAVTATGSPAPAITESGTLPSGVTFNTSTDTLSGTPAAGTGETYAITFTATSSAGSTTQNFTLTVDQAPAITSGASTTFTIGTAGSFTVMATGFPVPTISESGTLPSGVTFSAGVLSGIPAAGTGETYSISFTANNGVGSNTTQAFTLTVDQAPAITSATSATFTIGSSGTFNVTATGFPAPAISESGMLPSGVTFSAGVLSGIPASGTSGTYPITFTANNGVGANAVQSFTLTVVAASQSPMFTSATSTTFTVGSSGTFAVTATGSPTPTISESGTLPSGVTFNSSTYVLSGTPAAGTGGTYAITFTAKNSAATITQNFTLTVDQAPAITSGASTTFTVGTAGSFTVIASGFPKPGITESGTLPSGVTFNTSTGVLSGTPASGTAGTYPITFTASNGVGSNATQSFTLTVNAGSSGSTLKISPATLNFGTVYAGTTTLQETTLTNTGSTMITFTNFDVMPISGDDSSGFLGIELCPRTLNAGKSCVVVMSFTADSNVTKIHAANLLITNNALGSPQTVPMSATVINPQPYLSANYLSFGNQKTGTTSAAKKVTLTNLGTTPLTLSGLSVTGNFAIASGGCTSATMLAPGANCAINVTFTPATRGQKSGSVKITDNARNSPQYVTLSGNGD
jgi:YVTN family beta-propeller protein